MIFRHTPRLPRCAGRLGIAIFILTMALARGAQAYPVSTDFPARLNLLWYSFIGVTQPLNFGAINVPASGAGTVTVDPLTGETSATGAVSIESDGQRGIVAIFGPAVGDLNWVVTPSEVTMSRQGSGSLNASITISAPQARSTSDLQEAYFGGTVTIPAGTLPGDYAGQFVIQLGWN